ncbi:gp41 [Bacillus phage G]|uniref:Gp41 n=1 Tax=Bacillus phage G TaxID=2884420 RepID=G3MBB1_9CAUD|nr:gp41 [Bacillus phage G]AEO93312.1 gp41 [Bacillus phage G]
MEKINEEIDSFLVLLILSEEEEKEFSKYYKYHNDVNSYLYFYYDSHAFLTIKKSVGFFLKENKYIIEFKPTLNLHFDVNIGKSLKSLGFDHLITMERGIIFNTPEECVDFLKEFLEKMI